MITVYGIPNCDTIKKTLNWLKANGQDYTFFDYKKQGISTDKLSEWLKSYDWTQLVNRAGTTWEKLSDEEKAVINNNQAAIELMISKPSVIKRPLIEQDGQAVALGFDEKKMNGLFKK
jgi:arsenate reductase (glutaredoxin)